MKGNNKFSNEGVFGDIVGKHVFDISPKDDSAAVLILSGCDQAAERVEIPLMENFWATDSILGVRLEEESESKSEKERGGRRTKGITMHAKHAAICTFDCCIREAKSGNAFCLLSMLIAHF